MRELLRSWWHEPRPTGPARGWRDWSLVVVFMATALLEGVVRADLPAPTVVPVLIGVGLAPVLLWRRTRPLLMAAVAFPVCAAGEAVVGGDLGLHTLAFLLILVFSLSRWGSGREAVLGGAVVAAKITLSVAADHLGPGDALAGAGVVSAALALGAALRYRARARQREFEQVKLLERERLARDLHDTVAHHVSAMAVRAQAGLAVLDTQPDAAADALRIIEAEATRALVEMRAMVRVLRRDEPADRAPAPRITDLERLASRSAHGLAVEVELSGDLDGLPAPVATAIYRLAQESVTNARRHARRATRVVVRVARDAEVVRLRVSDDGEVPSPRGFGPTGFGLIGMRERAHLLGGSVDAGPDVERGWTVTATLPCTVPA
ncbi:sensor histidine kinase [Verrucosispora sp. CWR15]|uniref:histidine kinase n=1 Tax=Verrucosispora sioxanthis TaxID=2499994 RepID=A0A6M1KVG1_9ACTN|nr:histidine kinase [Verrucosispora sioxanthis]NEE63985.1 sensor histidine kinase [Verrucosispora sioxanthis]NGM13095.1 sensor histidine kinase [Verrucosispora sioxanthis]